MPELPEVHTVVTRLDGALRGAVVESVELFRNDVVKRGRPQTVRAIAGRTVLDVVRHGKRIEWRLAPHGSLYVHLGMTGNLLLEPCDAPIFPHTHIRIRFRDFDREVRFRDPRRFGGVWTDDARSGRAGGRFSTDLGPDALSVRLPGFRTALARRREVKALLLDQGVVAGLGNIYADESLHRARIHPRRLGASLAGHEVAELLAAIRTVLRAAIRAGGSSLRDYRNADGEPGWFQIRHRVYGRAGEPCRRCGTAIVSEVVAARTTHYCPRCQSVR